MPSSLDLSSFLVVSCAGAGARHGCVSVKCGRAVCVPRPVFLLDAKMLSSQTPWSISRQIWASRRLQPYEILEEVRAVKGTRA
ncbi:hypothetical protein GGTG_00137 [Gaeumannomyces tritici R3-111a-1]|uniref:Uncharacterized protein n=1 Tax=Gaeumannomyces tritici (strain R3-111a-1) TaxID=644352 RepID=J3NFU3_GAET3|nr:hypothetical protein GGTG_00137 [Gaeumannomyces tritici R3-111a-1]EJT80133.1 hypothetical protein GGTG_00137 [Gaeumannomyces tritici R3-111a-1]